LTGHLARGRETADATAPFWPFQGKHLMNWFRRFAAVALAAACLAAALPLPLGSDALAQSRTVKIVVPYAPGSGPDFLSRLMAEQIGRMQGATVVIENRPGGGTLIGTEAVARAAPDGNTVLLVANSFVVNPALKPVSYDVTGSFDPVCYLAATPMVLVVQGSSPHKTLNDLLAAARGRPGDLTLGAAPSSSLHMAFEVLKRSAKVNMTFVPFVSTGPAINALLGGHVTAVFADYPTVIGHLKSGTLRGLVTASEKRAATLPDVPTFANAGLVKYEADIFYGIVAPAKMQPDMLKQLSDWFSAALAAPEVQPRLAQLGLFRVGMCGAPFGDFMRKFVEEYARIIREAGIKAE
jgi:tripartite-type tricarboxylate transporter receptor subunit TctC